MIFRRNAVQAISPARIEASGRLVARGVPLPEKVRQEAEQLFGADFSEVRIHVGPEAARMGALAFTMGSDIYFAPGLYDPDSEKGLGLLGHELAHVVQQRSGRARNPHGYGVAVVRDEALEAEADRMGRALQMMEGPRSADADADGEYGNEVATLLAK
jgi:hypothetical protein